MSIRRLSFTARRVNIPACLGHGISRYHEHIGLRVPCEPHLFLYRTDTKARTFSSTTGVMIPRSVMIARM